MNSPDSAPRRGHGSSESPIVCLCSGFGLGMYIPGLLLRERIRGRGAVATAEVLESILSDDALSKVERSRKAYRASFEFALAAQRVPIDIRESIDTEKMAALFRAWERTQCRRFVCLSGHWVFVLEKYRDYLGSPIDVDLLYVDASMAPSWRSLAKLLPSFRDQYTEVFLYDSENLAVKRFIDAEAEPLPFADRDARLVVHGGGWGFGRIDRAVAALDNAGFQLDIVGHEWPDDRLRQTGRMIYLDDPAWRAWHLDAGQEIGFPSFAAFRSDEAPRFAQPKTRHGLYDSIRRARAIVSKPGGGTLLDSFATATPLVMLEPFGPHEVGNSRIWIENGFGIQFEDWARTDFSPDVLHGLHSNLVRSRAGPADYVNELLNG